MAQWLGFFGVRRPPNWFKEGLGDHLAGLGGVGVTDAEAIASIRNGRHFLLEERGGIMNSLHEAILAAGLEPVMFHQQTKMFVDFLWERDPVVFEGIVSDVLDGETIESSITARAGVGIEAVWGEFESKIANNEGG